MAHYRVRWQRHEIKASSWYTLGGVVIHASPCLRRWIGRRHADLVTMLNTKRGWPVRVITHVSDTSMPATAEYLKNFQKTVEALNKLLEYRNEET